MHNHLMDEIDYDIIQINREDYVNWTSHVTKIPKITQGVWIEIYKEDAKS